MYAAKVQLFCQNGGSLRKKIVSYAQLGVSFLKKYADYPNIFSFFCYFNFVDLEF